MISLKLYIHQFWSSSVECYSLVILTSRVHNMETRGIAVILLVAVLASGIAPPKKEYIHDCLLYWLPGNNAVVTFLCDHHFHEINYFQPIATKKCVNATNTFVNAGIGKIQFQDCQMSQMPYNIFATFSSTLRTLNISSMGLESLAHDFFVGAGPLERVNASHNRLTVVRGNQFANAANLVAVDFSFNKIGRIDAAAFDDRLVRLETVSLAHNAIQSVAFETFQKLAKLKYLNLSHNRLEAIDSGTFSTLKFLTAVDLSFNRLRVVDLIAVLPHFVSVRAFAVDGNPLVHVTGYTSSLFPQLLWSKEFMVSTTMRPMLANASSPAPEPTPPPVVAVATSEPCGSSSADGQWLDNPVVWVLGINSLLSTFAAVVLRLQLIKLRKSQQTEASAPDCRFENKAYDGCGGDNSCSANAENEYATVLI